MLYLCFLPNGLQAPEGKDHFLPMCSHGIWVSSGCYNTYHRFGGLINRFLFLTALEAGSPRSGGQHGRVLAEGPLVRTRLSLLGASREKSHPLFLRALTNPTQGGSILMTCGLTFKYFSSHRGLGFLHTNWGRDPNI